MLYIRSLDIEIYDPEKEPWAQARYLVHGHDDVLWTDDIQEALVFLEQFMSSDYDGGVIDSIQ